MPEFEIRSIRQAAHRGHGPERSHRGDRRGDGQGVLRQVFEAVGAAGVTPAGPPLTRYFTFGEPVIDFECAIPVAAPFTGHGDVKPGSDRWWRCGACVRTWARMTRIGQTWEAMMAWVSEQGRTPGGAGWESYLTDPSEEPDPSKWVTEVCMPLV